MSAAPVVVAWSPDEFGEVALRHAVARARALEAPVLVVNATRGDALVDPRWASGPRLEQLREEVAGQGVAVEVRQSLGGEVGDQVLAVTEEVGARLLVLGLRRRSPVGKLIMGSVAQRLLLGAGCPVLAVKPGQPLEA